MRKNNLEEIRKGYRRVTEILGKYSDFSMIEPHVLKNAADRGTRTHRFCELYVKNLLIQPIDADCKPYFESFVNWYDFIVDDVLYTEQRLYCDQWKITGQVDLILKLKGSDSTYIVDIKTPQTNSKSWQLQTAAYQYLATQGLGLTVQQRGCLMLDRNGGEAKFIGYSDYEKDIELFFSACKLNSFFGGS